MHFLSSTFLSLMYGLDTCIQRLPAQQAPPFFGQGPQDNRCDQFDRVSIDQMLSGSLSKFGLDLLPYLFEYIQPGFNPGVPCRNHGLAYTSAKTGNP